MPLSDLECRNAKPRDQDYKLTDGKGMHLLVKPSGARLWRLAYRFNGKQKTLSLGEYPVMKLPEAREKRDAARDQIAAGVDPMAERKKAKRPSGSSFKAIAEEFHNIWKAGKGAQYVTNVWSRFEADAFPQIGDLPVSDITPQHIIEMVRRVEDRGALDIARRLKQKCSEVFDYAIATGRCASNPTVSVRKAMKPKPAVRHRLRLPLSEMGSFLNRLDHYDGAEQTRLAIQFTLLTWVRTNEARFAQRHEFEDLDGKQPLWRISAARMKMRREHLVPLSPQAVTVVKRLWEMGSSDYLCPHETRPGQPMGENTMLFGLYRLGYHSRLTIHGFRGMASTWANEALVPNGDPLLPVRRYHPDWVEVQLAHVDDAVRSAYNSAEYLPARRRMLADWADWIDEQRVDEFEGLLG